jgi:serine/threonine-protein kinase RsbT
MEARLAIAVCSTGVVPLRSRRDVAICRRVVSEIAKDQGFSVVGSTMLVTATSELARNTILHGGGGEVVWTVVRGGRQVGIQLAFQDNGPGISNLDLAMTDGWTSGGGMGLGLSGARRLVHEFAIHSSLGKGTRVVILRWR